MPEKSVQVERVQLNVRMSTALHDAVRKAAEHPDGPADMSRLVRQSIRYCLPAENERLVSKKRDLDRKARLFLVDPHDKQNVERIAKARYAARREDSSNSDVVNECVRRYLIQYREKWGLMASEDLAAIHLTEAVWPHMALIEPFFEDVVPADVFAMLKKFYLRSDGPSTLPELMRLVRKSLPDVPQARNGFALVSLTPDEIVQKAKELLTTNAQAWRID